MLLLALCEKNVKLCPVIIQYSMTWIVVIKKSDNLILTYYILDNDCQLNILLKFLKVDWTFLKNLSQSDICLLPHFLGKMGVFDISFTNTYNSILLCTEYTYAYTTVADIVGSNLDITNLNIVNFVI